jgi:hypothetical protein
MSKPNLTAARLKGWFNKWSGRYRPIFTPMGGAVCIIAIFILVRSLVIRNSYEIVFSSAMLLLILIIAVVGVWKSKKLKLMEAGWIPPFPMTANLKEVEYTQITGLDGFIPLFFRLHYFVRGRFFPCGSISGNSVLVETSVPRGEVSAKLLLDFPMSGVFKGDGYCCLRDIFGFFSFSCGQPQQRTIKARCTPCFGKKTQINAQTGAEDQRKKPASDIERYYMREYTPGDRFRDINWKSSEKIDTLITRISADNQEKISRIEIYFRNYGPILKGESLEALWLLDRAKARLSYFLRSLMEQNSSFIFDVCTANGRYEILNQNDLDTFLEELAGLSFMPSQYEKAIQQKSSSQTNTADMYVFSTACDTGLHAFLITCNPRPVNLFIMQPEKKSENIETEVLYIKDFFIKGGGIPPRWLTSGKVKPLGVQANKVEMYYAEIKL